MLSFFHGWRRKAGCVTLVMACMVFGGWMRSRIACDAAEFTIGHRRHRIMSTANCVSWYSCDEHGVSMSQRRWWSSVVFKEPRRNDQDYWKARIADQVWHTHKGFAAWTVKYSSLAIPLTLLSAYLLLWKPRKRQNTPDQLTNPDVNSN